MSNWIRNLFVASIVFMSGAAMAAAELGKDYNLLNPVMPTNTKNIEVLEFYSYACSHCFHLHPQLSAWEKTMPKDVELSFVPVMFSSSAEPFARTYFALESMGQSKQLHEAIYRAIHVENLSLFDKDSLANFVAKKGVDKAKFLANYDSFSMQSKVERAKQMIRSYGISGTPTLVVDGKYTISGLQPEVTIRVLREVIEIARKDHPAAAAETKPAAKSKTKH